MLEQLKAAVDRAQDNTKARRAELTTAQELERATIKAYNVELLKVCRLTIGDIVEVPSQWSWEAARGKVNRLALEIPSAAVVGMAVGRVATKANKLHKGNRRLIKFKIEEATDTGFRVQLKEFDQ